MVSSYVTWNTAAWALKSKAPAQLSAKRLLRRSSGAIAVAVVAVVA
eukprot:CAMPEP_0115089834 /NCGR_PEP_ID=MMETSP0227-20121206/24989_1 /TAXON_ID=89957 /ORGANISM="Polarella glacialis, Strain CCMP 1383" /LENGTH=45 /DNA_ID= /DNA_START= /DNA_END= /DNA_ORIENTATION=